METEWCMKCWKWVNADYYLLIIISIYEYLFRTNRDKRVPCSQLHHLNNNIIISRILLFTLTPSTFIYGNNSLANNRNLFIYAKRNERLWWVQSVFSHQVLLISTQTCNVIDTICRHTIQDVHLLALRNELVLLCVNWHPMFASFYNGMSIKAVDSVSGHLGFGKLLFVVRMNNLLNGCKQLHVCNASKHNAFKWFHFCRLKWNDIFVFCFTYFLRSISYIW